MSDATMTMPRYGVSERIDCDGKAYIHARDTRPVTPDEVMAEAGRQRAAASMNLPEVRAAMAADPDEQVIAIPADPDDDEDRDVSLAAAKRGQLSRALHLLRRDLGLTIEAFAARYAIPAADYAEYESGYGYAPPAVAAYLRVIVAEPEVVARVAAKAA